VLAEPAPIEEVKKTNVAVIVNLMQQQWEEFVPKNNLYAINMD